MDRNTLTGFLLISLVLFLWFQFYQKPMVEEEIRKKKQQDSIVLASKALEEKKSFKLNETTGQDTNQIIRSDSSVISQPSEQFVDISNDVLQLKFSNKGGRLVEATLNKYSKLHDDSSGHEIKTALKLFEDKKNVFDYVIETSTGIVHTSDLYYVVVEPSQNKQITFKANIPGGGQFYQSYILKDDYTLEYQVKLNQVQTNKNVQFVIHNYLDRLEKNHTYEKAYTSVYFKEKDKNSDYCSCRSDDKKEITKNKISWFAFSNQFFNTSIISDKGFVNGVFETENLQENSDDLKLLKSKVEIPIEDIAENEYKMQWYLGPNDYKRLATFENQLTDIIPYGWSIFGSINRHLIRPLFLFLSNYIGSMGLVILLMTLVVKLLVFPLGYKMLQSQAKMMALKPEIEKVKNKFKDDMQKQQMETMKMYNEYGVNPLGGCMPMLLQMPIWISLYRFFPATIEFRQASFLWATDLTSYDVFFRLPFNIPLFGDTISLFAFLWMISTLVFTYYSSKSMDFSSNPAMMYMQYFMPFMLWFMFNRTAAGLSCYMFFSNLLNIGQTLLGRTVLFDHDKIRANLELNKSKPKKKGGFQARMEEMMKEQQRIQAEKAKKK